MADNTTLPGTGDVIAADDILGVKHQQVKIEFGADGTATPVSAANPLPVTASSLPLPAGAATDAGLASLFARLADGSQATAIVGSVPVTGAFFQATQPVSGPLTDAQLRAVAVPVSGTVSTGLSQPLTDTQLRAVAVPVSGTFWQATQPVSGTFFQATQPVSIASWTGLTDTQLRASAVPVSIATLPALTTGAAVIGAVTQSGTWTMTQQAITKGTQGSTGITTQDLKDSGRSARTITLDSFAVAATAETLMTMSYSTDNGTLTTGTSYPVTTAKRLRLQCISVGLHTIAGNTTAVNVIVRVRVNNAGTGIVTSPVQMVVPVQGIAAANQAGMPVLLDFPDGWEFVAGAGISVTVQCAGFIATTAAPKVDITIIGYEY